MLAGRFKGKRAVFIKQLPSGLLLVTGAWLRARGCARARRGAAATTATAPVCARAPHPFRRAGPYGVNGVPLRRVNQAYVIATSSSADVSGVKLPAELAGTDRTAESKFFKAAVTKVAKGRAGFLEAQKAAEEKKGGASEARKAAQTAVDGGVKLAVGGKDFTAYLKATFALSKGDLPHAMKF